MQIINTIGILNDLIADILAFAVASPLAVKFVKKTAEKIVIDESAARTLDGLQKLRVQIKTRAWWDRFDFLLDRVGWGKALDLELGAAGISPNFDEFGEGAILITEAYDRSAHEAKMRAND